MLRHFADSVPMPLRDLCCPRRLLCAPAAMRSASVMRVVCFAMFCQRSSYVADAPCHADECALARHLFAIQRARL